MNDKQIKVKTFLSKAYYIDQMIQSKLDQVQILNDLAMKATVILTDMPGGSKESPSKMEDSIVKVLDLQSEISLDIIDLINIKSDIIKCIKQVDDFKGRLILEERYINYNKWEEIADLVGCSLRQVFRKHDSLLEVIEII